MEDERKIEIDKSKCTGCQLCTMRAKKIFRLGPDKKAYAEGKIGNFAAIDEIVKQCPTGAITLVGEPPKTKPITVVKKSKSLSEVEVAPMAEEQKEETIVETKAEEQSPSVDSNPALADVDAQIAAKKDELAAIIAQISLRQKTFAQMKKDAEGLQNEILEDSEKLSADTRAQAEEYAKGKKATADEYYKKAIEEAKAQAEKILEDAKDEKKTLLAEAKEKSVAATAKEDVIKAKEEDLATKEEQLRKKETEMLAGRADSFHKQLEDQQAVLKNLDTAIADKRKELNELIANQAKTLDDEYQKKKQALETEIVGLAKKSATLKNEKQALLDGQKKLEDDRFLLEQRNATIQSRYDHFDQEVEKAVEEQYSAQIEHLNNRIKSLQQHLANLDGEYQKLSADYAQLQGSIRASELSKVKDADKTIAEKDKEIAQLQEENKTLARKLLNDGDVDTFNEMKGKLSSYETMKGTLARVSEEKGKLDARQATFIDQTAQLNDERAESQRLKAEIERLNEELQKHAVPGRAERLSALSNQIHSVEESRKITQPFELSEVEWLEKVMADTEASNIKLPKRVFYAFHTSLKIREWSPLVVLAGVSGTGKSELPRQYAVHGGLTFLPVAVKPDWDSPQSLFGFYNSIENRLQPTELLQVLYKFQLNRPDLHGMDDRMVMILLDEMNLAHPELYFSDMLSKFETARGTGAPVIYDVDLGAGEHPEPVTIDGNILWSGTMNEDETTKALSDKVVDRSTLISFSRPPKLYSRPNSSIVPADHYLKFSTWKLWLQTSLKTEQLDPDTIAEFNEIVSKINDLISGMGRNLGHRVWQGIENYVANHPLVNKHYQETKTWDEEGKRLMKQAFTEAVAFKVMPKLRGLETRGAYSASFEDLAQYIGQKIPDLLGDFNVARGLDSGVFQWTTSDFLGRDF
jgi:ferredoxin